MIEELKELARDFLGPSPSEQPRIDDISLRYSYQDLYNATRGFSVENRLGAGAAGAVYRGTLRGGTEVAIKVLLDAGGLGGFEEEVRVLSRVRHPNLVTLLGWGHKEGAKYLVYELLLGGDVSNKLEKCKKGKDTFTWSERLRVAHDAAKGLSHMMNSKPKVFHRDIKPANMLLCEGGGAKVADFGLASIATERKQHLTVDQISGTPGYACPSYIRSGHVSEKSEVYSFGIALLELLLNQPPALAGPQGDIVYPLLQVVQPNVPGAHARVLSALDQRANWPRQVADEFIDCAISCVHMMPDRRPDFEQVVRTCRHLTSKTGGSSGSSSKPAGLLGDIGGLMPQLGAGGSPWVGGNIFGNIGGMGGRSAPSPMGGNPYASMPPPGNNPYASYPAQSPAGNNPYASMPAGGSTPRGGGSTPGGHDRGKDDPSRMLAEVVLEVVSAEGCDLASLPRAHKAIAFAVDPTKGRLSFIVGREYQPDFFDRVVVKQDQRQTISRSHFELCWEPPASSPTLRKLSSNPLMMDDRSLNTSEANRIPDGTRLGFAKSEDDRRFLIMRVTLRSRGAVTNDGQHPAVALSLHRSSRGPGAGSPVDAMATLRPGTNIYAVLECVHSSGRDVRKLSSQDRVIPIPMEEEVDVGRQHQPPNFFENLLQGESRWLTFISRSHFRVQLQRLPNAGPMDTASGYGLRLENFSSNPLIVKKLSREERRLGKGRSDVLAENEKLVFVANPGGQEGETQFLEFLLRRARGTT